MRNEDRERLAAWKERRHAVILAHNYQPGAIQDLADYNGDSLQLSRMAAETDAEVIVFCGVHFMAETAAILSPEKTVLLPALDAGCPMADMITAVQVQSLKRAHPEAPVICYVNSSAAVKAVSDCCCTSSNAVEVLRSFPDAEEVIFVPDRNLGGHATAQTGQRLVPWEGYCPIHQDITAEEVARARAAHPGAVVMVHPECPKPVRDAADRILSTGQMCTFARESDHEAFLVGTEVGILYRLREENPAKQFFPVRSCAECEDMKRIGVSDVIASLERLQHVVTVPPEIAAKARCAIERMLALA